MNLLNGASLLALAKSIYYILINAPAFIDLLSPNNNSNSPDLPLKNVGSRCYSPFSSRKVKKTWPRLLMFSLYQYQQIKMLSNFV